MTAALGSQTFLLQNGTGLTRMVSQIPGPCNFSSPFAVLAAIARNLDYPVSSMPRTGTAV